MKIVWSVPVPGEPLSSSRGDLVRARRLMDGLSDQGHEIQPVVASDGAAARTSVRTYRGALKCLLPDSVSQPIKAYGRLAMAWSHGRRVRDRARLQGADLIVETQVHGVPSGARAARAAGIPLVLDDCSPPEEAAVLGDQTSPSIPNAFRHEASVARALLVSSLSLARRIQEKGVPADKIFVVPNGVDVTELGPENRTDIRKKLGLGNRMVVAFAGSFQPWHRVDLLLHAARRLAESAPIHLLLIGDGMCRAEAFQKASRLGLQERTTFTGPIPPERLQKVLGACDLGVLPGTNDYGQPMKLLDYLAAGLPAVAPDLPPVRAIIRDRKTGWLFPPEDSDGLFQALLTLVREPSLRLPLGEAGRARAEEQTWSHSAATLTKALTRFVQAEAAV